MTDLLLLNRLRVPTYVKKQILESSPVLSDLFLSKQFQRFLTASDFSCLGTAKQWAAAEAEQAHQQDIRLVTFFDDGYPRLLREIDDSPIVLYTRGDLGLLNSTPPVAVVGARKVSNYGETVAERFTRELACAGAIVVSGGALGVDCIAHQTALRHQGRTIAVMGAGIDRAYPACHRKMFERIAHSDLVLSEFAFGSPPLKHHFPQRNRIISGLSLATVVVEADLRSGSLITARFAAEQGRAVFAIPHPVDSRSGRGGNRLLQSGAQLAVSARDVLDEIAPQLSTTVPEGKRLEESDAGHRKIVDLVKRLPGINVSELCDKTELDMGTLYAAITELQVRGLLKRSADGSVRLL